MQNLLRGTKEEEDVKATKSKCDDSKKKCTMDEHDRKEIADLAYKFFTERGGKHGHDKEDWYKAETTVKNKKMAKK